MNIITNSLIFGFNITYIIQKNIMYYVILFSKYIHRMEINLTYFCDKYEKLFSIQENSPFCIIEIAAFNFYLAISIIYFPFWYVFSKLPFHIFYSQLLEFLSRGCSFSIRLECILNIFEIHSKQHNNNTFMLRTNNTEQFKVCRRDIYH